MSTLLSVRNLKKYFDTAHGTLHAVENVSFELEERTTLAAENPRWAERFLG